MANLKLTKLLSYTCFFSLILSFSLIQGSDRLTSKKNVGQHQIQTQLMISRNDVLQQYQNLFLDDWQKLVLHGHNKEAAEFAAKKEVEICDILNKSFDKNIALVYNEYQESKHRKMLDPNEHYSQSFFRTYASDPQKLIENHEENIKSLESQLTKRNQTIEKLEHEKKTAPNQKETLRKEIDKDYKMNEDHFSNLENTIHDLPSSAAHLKELVSKNIAKANEIVNKIYLLVESSPDKLDPSSLESTKKEIRIPLDEITYAFEPLLESILERTEDRKEEQEKLRRIKYTFDKLKSSYLWLIDKIGKWKNTDPHATLNKWDAELIEKMKKAHKAFIEDTEQQIAKETLRINFIKANQTFFKVSKHSRAHILGIEDPSLWSGVNHTLKLGNDVVVGIIDSFGTYKQTSRILEKSINPDFQGEGLTLQIGKAPDSGDHGILVAGIIVSDLIDKNDNSMTLGVAPDAKFEMLSHQSLTASPQTTKFGSMAPTENWTVEKMSDSITELAQTGKVEALGISFDDIIQNPIVSSPSKILNWSMSTTNLSQFGRSHISQFEGEDILLVLVKSLLSKLLVIALGNDGIDVSSTPQLRLTKAQAHSPATSPHLILVTNLMQDGLTLNPSSNIPGNQPYLKARTLSAPGTDVTSTNLMRSEEEAAYKEVSGTSAATPHVSGVAAVVLSNHPRLTMKELADCLLEGATPLLINDEGVTMELPDILSGELASSFNKNHWADTIKVRSTTVKRADWERGQASYGQGRVNLKGALKVAKENDLT